MRHRSSQPPLTGAVAMVLAALLFALPAKCMAQNPVLESMSDKNLFKKADVDFAAGRLEDAREAIRAAIRKKKKAKPLIYISLVPRVLKTNHSLMFQSGGEVSWLIILIISGRECIDRIAENPSSPHNGALNWFMLIVY